LSSNLSTYLHKRYTAAAYLTAPYTAVRVQRLSACTLHRRSVASAPRSVAQRTSAAVARVLAALSYGGLQACSATTINLHVDISMDLSICTHTHTHTRTHAHTHTHTHAHTHTHTHTHKHTHTHGGGGGHTSARSRRKSRCRRGGR
jgi:hypothetical protein